MDRLGFAPGGDEAVAPQLRQVLGQRGLLEPDDALERADGPLSLMQLAQDHQPVRVGERAHQARRFSGPRLHRL